MVFEDILSVFRDRNFYVSIILASAGIYLLEETIVKSLRGMSYFSGMMDRLVHVTMAGAGTVFMIVAVLFMVDMFR